MKLQRTGGVKAKLGRKCQKRRAIRAIDLFSGAGGSSWGAYKAGLKIVAAFDSWKLAGKNHKQNFPDTKFILGKLERLTRKKLKQLKRDLGRIDVILASPECTSHS